MGFTNWTVQVEVWLTASREKPESAKGNQPNPSSRPIYDSLYYHAPALQVLAHSLPPSLNLLYSLLLLLLLVRTLLSIHIEVIESCCREREERKRKKKKEKKGELFIIIIIIIMGSSCDVLRLFIAAGAVAVAVVLLAGGAEGHNITAILEGFPEYSLYNSYLTQTKVCDEIDSRETVTCLVLPNAAMAALASKQSLGGIKNALRLLNLLDYFDPQKLHDLPRGTTLTTTLYQTTGDAPGDLGFVNITNLRGGRVGFASAAPGAKFDASYTKSVRQIPYNLSVLEVSAPILFPGLLDAPSAASANITALLDKAGCKTFASLVASSGVLKIYQAAMDKGLTLLAPNDDAFKSPDAPDLSSLSSADLVALLQYHALPSYTPKSSLKTAKGPLSTLASSASGKYDLSVVSSGDDVSLVTGVDTSRVASTVLDDTPVCILTVDSLLLPVELFGAAPAPAPGPAGAAAPAPAPALAPAPAPKAKAPSPAHARHRAHHASPPAPPASTPASSPADGPAAEADKADVKKAAATAVRAAGTLATVALASAVLVVATFL
ncbi:fasciclin-like arabinogalactan protein 8 [Ananas comosus]|uniref:Fasciclin-like arabinogalactan protein 8 n=1 Tax=Ananas comosus TaxID=4615 RepID=A0A6P5EN88_ANACO|nr:fasciclin-like arabinogalactan protein 8 [Ananas comosus]